MECWEEPANFGAIRAMILSNAAAKVTYRKIAYNIQWLIMKRSDTKIYPSEPRIASRKCLGVASCTAFRSKDVTYPKSKIRCLNRRSDAGQDEIAVRHCLISDLAASVPATRSAFCLPARSDRTLWLPRWQLWKAAGVEPDLSEAVQSHPQGRQGYRAQ